MQNDVRNILQQSFTNWWSSRQGSAAQFSCTRFRNFSKADSYDSFEITPIKHGWTSLNNANNWKNFMRSFMQILRRNILQTGAILLQLLRPQASATFNYLRLAISTRNTLPTFYYNCQEYQLNHLAFVNRISRTKIRRQPMKKRRHRSSTVN